LFDARYGVVFGVTLVSACSRPAVNGERLDAAFFGDAGNSRPVAVLPIPAGSHLERYRHVDRGDDGVEDSRDKRFVLHQCRAGESPAHLLCRAAHVDVDDLGAPVNAGAGSEGHLLRFGAGNLHGDRFGVEVEVEPVAGLRRLPQAGVSRGHLGGRHAGPEVAAELAERLVRHAGHRCEHERAVEPVRTDFQRRQ
jgi:hypothetical protein